MHEPAPPLEQDVKPSDRPGPPAISVAEPLEERHCVSADIPVAGNKLRLFADSAPLVEAMVADIRSARRRAWVECYTICDDAAGQAVAEALKDRARAGVDCRVMYDAIGSLTTPASYFDDLVEAGVQVHAFHSLWNVVQRFASLRPFNRRNHRKLTVVDEGVAYFGGMNLVDQSGIRSLEDARQRHVPVSAGWRDVHARLAGPQAEEIAHCMDVHWRSQHGQRRLPWPRWRIGEMLAARQDGIWFFDSAPRIRKRRPARVLVPLIRQARRRIVVSMAYFIPVGPVLRELLRARRRGVEVEVILPQQSDVRLVQWASQYLYEKLLKRGIRIFERQDRMLHSKAMVVDDQWSVIGSCNLDPRSLRLNTEFLAVVRSAAAAAQLKQLCSYEMQQSREVRAADCRRRAWWQRLRDRLAWSCRRWL
jgi:cardiolipin synthase